MDERLYARIKELMMEIDSLAGEGKPVCVALTPASIIIFLF